VATRTDREYELAVVREAIAAKTDPALGADIPKAAEHLLPRSRRCAFRDERGKLRSTGNSTDLGLFFYFVWRRIMRYGSDATQRSRLAGGLSTCQWHPAPPAPTAPTSPGSRRTPT
jgi:hypothetical protein